MKCLVVEIEVDGNVVSMKNPLIKESLRGKASVEFKERMLDKSGDWFDYCVSCSSYSCPQLDIDGCLYLRGISLDSDDAVVKIRVDGELYQVSVEEYVGRMLKMLKAFDKKYEKEDDLDLESTLILNGEVIKFDLTKQEVLIELLADKECCNEIRFS